MATGALLLLLAFVLTLVAGTTLAWMLYAWRTPAGALQTAFSDDGTAPAHAFSIIVPARHEQAVLGQTLDQLAAMEHPAFEVLVVIGHDDPETHEVARQASLRHPDLVRVLVDHSVPKNKPKALNTALEHVRGDVLCVFDAEDEVAPGLLTRLDAHLQQTGAAVVQGGVQLMDHHSSWYAVHNVLEYYFWFRSRLHFQADKGFIPLGGNTFVARTDIVRQHGGWDEDCLAEDCDLGVRLSASGHRVAVAYEPDLVTREETPPTLGQFLKQRTRWNQGFLQVLRKGDWKRLPTRTQRAFARWTLMSPFFQAFAGVLLPISLITAFVAKPPVGISMLTFLPLLPTVTTLMVQLVGLHEFCAAYGTKMRVRDGLRLVLGFPFFQVLLSVAAVRAVSRELRHERSWEKTAHTNSHRVEAAPVSV